MVGVQEGERLLLQEEESGIDELEVLCKVIELWLTQRSAARIT